MKKPLAVLLIVFGLFLWTGGAVAYTINDNVDDAIEGSNGLFESYGINVAKSGSFLNIDLYTSYKGPLLVGQWTTYYADLAIDVDGVAGYEYGFTLKSYNGNTLGALYKNAGWLDSDYHKEHDVSGTKYSYIFNQYIITTVQNVGTPLSTPGFSVSDPPYDIAGWGDTSDYTISFQLALSDLGLTSSGDYTLKFLWGTATCANDVVQGSTTVHVPEPATMLLLGFGLIGLVGFGRKKFQ